MPMQWVPPAPFLTYKGKTIYRAYKDQGEVMLSYWFNADRSEEEEFQFDVRELLVPDWLSGEGSWADEIVAAIIIWNIEQGNIKFPEGEYVEG